MRTIERWRVFFLVSLGIVTPFCLAEFYPSHIHQISAMYTDRDRSDRILHELDVYKTRSDIRLDATECYVLVITAKCGTRNTINQELGVPHELASLAPMAHLRAEL